MRKIIGVAIDGEPTWHVIGVGPADYDTLCGIDAHDPDIGHQGTIRAKRGQKVDCQQCKTMWANIRLLKLRASDFM